MTPPLLLLLRLLQQGGGDPKPPKVSPFVRDTLFPIVGGPFQIRDAFPPIGNRFRAVTEAPLAGQPGDTVVKVYNKLTPKEYAHEAGHILDHRQLAPFVFADAIARRGEYRNPNDYFGSDSDEYGAEAFARAVESGRRGFADSTQVDRRFPGAIQFIRWLRTRPPFVGGDTGNLISGS